MTVRAVLTVDLRKISRNIEKIKKITKRDIYAVLKANAYGMGAVKIAQYIEKQIGGICVATPQEGADLRRNGIKKPILVFDTFDSDDFAFCKSYDLIASIHTKEALQYLTKLNTDDIPKFSVAVDTGMNRFGLSYRADVRRDLSSSERKEKIVFLYTHYYKGEDEKAVEKQRILFEYFYKNNFENTGVFPLLSADNSSSVFSGFSKYDFCRVGLGLYGFFEKGTEIAVRITARILLIKTVDRGQSVGYDALYVAPSKKNIAVVSFGYADGYPVSLGGVGFVFVRGRRAPVVGKVCMDCLFIDVTEIPEAAVFDEVVVFGEENFRNFSDNGVLLYDFLCGVGPRVLKKYLC